MREKSFLKICINRFYIDSLPLITSSSSIMLRKGAQSGGRIRIGYSNHSLQPIHLLKSFNNRLSITFFKRKCSNFPCRKSSIIQGNFQQTLLMFKQRLPQSLHALEVLYDRFLYFRFNDSALINRRRWSFPINCVRFVNNSMSSDY